MEPRDDGVVEWLGAAGTGRNTLCIRNEVQVQILVQVQIQIEVQVYRRQRVEHDLEALEGFLVPEGQQRTEQCQVEWGGPQPPLHHHQSIAAERLTVSRRRERIGRTILKSYDLSVFEVSLHLSVFHFIFDSGPGKLNWLIDYA